MDKVKALGLVKKAAIKENAQAQDVLGVMYYNGEGGLKKDRAEAAKWYRKSAEQGYIGAQTHLSTMYYYGHGGLKQDKEKAELVLKLTEAAAVNNVQVAILDGVFIGPPIVRQAKLTLSRHKAISDWENSRK